ncbi:MAG: hypothetical protein ACREV6_19490 [Clostridium sp.]
MIIILLLFVMGICTLIALPLGIASGIAKNKAAKADIIFKQEVLKNMKKS